MQGKFIVELYNNGANSWFHILPVDHPDAKPLLNQYYAAKDKFKDVRLCHFEIYPYNNSFWSIVKADNIADVYCTFGNRLRQLNENMRGKYMEETC